MMLLGVWRLEVGVVVEGAVADFSARAKVA